jgi:nucleosome binding factor SPN SPT16 subunit
MEATPTFENQKFFMVFEGEVTPENLMFQGDLLDFADSYFAANSWNEVLQFVKDNNYSFYLEGTTEYDEMNVLLDAYEAEQDEAREEYEASGDISLNGLYDAGGHSQAERWTEFADILKDQRKYGD